MLVLIAAAEKVVVAATAREREREIGRRENCMMMTDVQEL